jgi:transcriptional regulator with XRE-family HTH domain
MADEGMIAATFGNIGRAVALIRQETGLSQAALAYKCGIGRSQLSKYETGKETMRLDTLGRVLGVLHVEPEHFFRFVRSIEQAFPSNQSFRDRVEDLALQDAFQSLHSAIDNLQKVLERSRHRSMHASPTVGLGPTPADAAVQEVGVAEEG